MPASRRGRTVAGAVVGVVIVGAVIAASLGRSDTSGARAGSAGGTSSAAVATPTAGQNVAATPSTSAHPSASASATARPGAIPPLASIVGPAHPVAGAARSAAPVQIRIPSIGVVSALQPLHVEAGGVLQTPAKFPVAGWYAGGVRPGDIGPAVIAGHVDSVAGPAIFYRLRDLKPGAAVYVKRADGSTIRFTVAGTQQFPKNHFPTEAVYGPTAVPTLRLITCTGDFDRAKRSYVDNLVVTAYL